MNNAPIAGNPNDSLGARLGLAWFDWAVLAVLAALAVATGRLVLAAPAAVGQWQDDGVYLVTAKALASGEGYRRIDLPGSPWQTKYPILFPALLSLVWRVWPAFPDNASAMRTLSLVLGAGGFWLAYWVMRRAWRLPALIAGPALVAAWLNPGWVGLLQTPMSEPLFLLLSMAALWLVHRAANSARQTAPAASPAPADGGGTPQDPPGMRRGLALTLAAAGMAGAAYLTRSIGLAAAAAVVVERLGSRRWGAAAVALAVGAAAAGGWHAWRHTALQANRGDARAAALRYELDYSAWRPNGAAEAVRIAVFNAPAVALGMCTAIVPLDAGGVEWAVRGGGAPLALLAAVVALVVVMSLIGAVVTFSRHAVGVHAFLLFYLCLVLLWPFPPDRFLAAIQPLLFGLFFAGVGVTLMMILRRFAAGAEREPSLLSAVRRGGLADCARQVLSGWPTARWGVVALAAGMGYVGYGAVARPGAVVDPVCEREQAAFADMLRTQTPADAVIACGHGGYLHLQTGRRFVLFLPIDDPVELLYSEDRRWWQCGATFSPEEVERARVWIRTRLEGYLRRVEATHVVLKNDRSLFSVLFREYCESRPGVFARVADDDVGALHRFNGR